MPASQRYSIVEPHPSVTPSTTYLHTGRGGAGNMTKVPTTVTRGSDATGPAARASISSLTQPRKSIVSGRGGAGNIHHNVTSSEHTIFAFDEELERQLSQERHVAPVYHVGRGGAGNVLRSSNRADSNAFFDTRRSSDGASAKSTSSAESGADIATRNLKKGWRKITGAAF